MAHPVPAQPISASSVAFGPLTSASPGQQLHLRRPDDWHVHLRDGAMLQAVVAATASVPDDALVTSAMYNLGPNRCITAVVLLLPLS